METKKKREKDRRTWVMLGKEECEDEKKRKTWKKGRGRNGTRGRRTRAVITAGHSGPTVDHPRSDPGSDPLAMGKR